MHVSLLCLIVDDSATFLDAATALLKREGVTVVGVASDSAQALARAKELHPDVILLDIMLGGESGFDVAWRLADSELDGIAVILISTHIEEDFEDLIEEAPVTGFLQKSELSAAAISALMERHREKSGTRQDC
jgi:two-component system, NarL family, nitrate/nitrite response regulator NarL